jgi:hypothetical protein
MAKIFTKLNLADIVATSGGKSFRKLSTEEPQETIVGTWVFDKGDVNYDLFAAAANGAQYTPLLYSASDTISPILGKVYVAGNRNIIYNKYSYGGYGIRYRLDTNWLYFSCANENGTPSGAVTLQPTGLSGLKGKTWTFYDTCNDPDIVYNPVLLEWLKTFATKQ